MTCLRSTRSELQNITCFKKWGRLELKLNRIVKTLMIPSLKQVAQLSRCRVG